jgi:hypothetical protein
MPVGETALFLAVVTAVLLVVPTAPGAHKLLEVYEDWSTPTIRADRWLGRADDAHEMQRTLPHDGSRLVMRYKRVGRLLSGSAFVFLQHRMFLSNAALIDHLEADFRVRHVEVAGCPENPRQTRVRPAVIDFKAFSDGTPGGPDDQTGDHILRLHVNQEENATDPSELTVQAFLFRCVDPACANAIADVSDLNIGTVRVGRRFTLRALWDRDAAQFRVGFNRTPDVVLAYNPALDVTNARVPFASVRQQLVVSDCTSTRALADAEIVVLEVRTNSEAIIP